MIMIAPSILSADFTNLLKDIRDVEQANVNMLHIDVMDGHFVPNISIGIPVIKSIKKITELPLDIHLMIIEPERYIEDFINAGGNYITVHAEACLHLHRVVESIRKMGGKPSVALNPATPLSALDYIINEIDMVLLMTVDPGFGGQSFINGMEKKIWELKNKIQKENPRVRLQVDGGINMENISDVVKAGADIIVAGSAIFESRNVKETIYKLRKKAEGI